MARLYVDENLAGNFVSELRGKGHNVVFAGDAGEGRTDAWHFQTALRDERIMLTLDRRDYQYFHRLWTTLKIMHVVEQGHAGILVAVQTKGFSHADWLQALEPKLAAPEELRGRMSRWHPIQGWHEDDWKPEE